MKDPRKNRVLTGRRFAVIVADPPWKFRDKLSRKRGAARQYKNVLPLDAIKAFRVPPIADDAFLFMWRVASQVEEAYEVVRAWGFVPKTEIVWVKKTSRGKRHMGMGHTVRGEHEVCIVATRGRPRVKSRGIRSTFDTINFDAPVGRHSEKPEIFFEIVEALAEGPYVELFARRRRRGWTCLGNEVGVLPERRRAA